MLWRRPTDAVSAHYHPDISSNNLTRSSLDTVFSVTKKTTACRTAPTITLWLIFSREVWCRRRISLPAPSSPPQSGLRGRRDQFGGKTSSVGSGLGAWQLQTGSRPATKYREINTINTIHNIHLELGMVRWWGLTEEEMVTLCHPYDQGITCLCDSNKAVLR